MAHSNHAASPRRRQLGGVGGSVDRWKAKLDYRGPIRRAGGRLKRDLEAEAVAASTSMEGIPVTVEEVHRILAGDRPPETSEEDAALVRGYRDAMSFVLRRADDAAFRGIASCSSVCMTGFLPGTGRREREAFELALLTSWTAGRGGWRCPPAPRKWPGSSMRRARR